VAKTRGRPVENKWIGQRIDEPDIDLAMMARAQGAVGIGPVRKIEDLRPSIEKAIQEVKNGAVCVVDVRVLPGYDSAAHPTPAAASRR
jgi:TPP-dependent trihydroxycyclohexane-1,2-dione (THcHDO) dehydratase